MAKNLPPIFIFLIILSCGKPQESDSNSKVQMDSLEAKIDSLESINLDLQDQLTNIKKSDPPADLSYEAEFIKEQLRKNTGLIEMKSVLGGTMYFSDIRVLNRKWIMATYEDGHVQGTSLIQYDAVEDSILKFKVLDSIEQY